MPVIVGCITVTGRFKMGIRTELFFEADFDFVGLPVCVGVRRGE